MMTNMILLVHNLVLFIWAFVGYYWYIFLIATFIFGLIGIVGRVLSYDKDSKLLTLLFFICGLLGLPFTLFFVVCTDIIDKYETVEDEDETDD